jgi:hypothetical protein
MFQESYTKQEIAQLMKGAPTSGIIEVRLKDPKRTGSVTLRDYTYEDEQGSTEYRPFIDANGNPRVVKYTKKKKLNMNRDNDRLEYAHLKDHPIYVKGAKPILYLYNFDDEASQYVARKDAASKADSMITAMSSEQLRDLARVVQIRVMPGSSDIVLKRALYEYAESKVGSHKTLGALQIISEIESPDYDTKVLLYRAIESKDIVVKNGRYLFGQIGLGTSFDVSLQFLKDNADLESELIKKMNFKKVK